jgi:hypothetical protein
MSPVAVIELVRQLIAIVLSLVPKEVAEQLLTDEAVKRANAIADGAELAKFGPKFLNDPKFGSDE